MPRALVDLGIDLGTTKCAAVYAIRRPDGGNEYQTLPILQPIDADQPRRAKVERNILPSVLYVNRAGQIVVGEAAMRRTFLEPERTITSVKMWLGKDFMLHVAGQRFAPREVASELLKAVLASLHARQYAVRRCIVTVPASFDLRQKQETRDSARRAGINFEESLLLDEPTAAFLSLYANHQSALELQQQAREHGQLVVLVVDIGGGTSDISVIQVESVGDELQPVVLATSERSEGAGDHFDEAIAGWLAQRFLATRNDIDLEELSEQQRVSLAGSLIQAAREIKHSLSDQRRSSDSEGVDRRDVLLPGISTAFGSQRVPVTMDYEDLAEALQPYCSADSERSIQSQIRRVLDGDELQQRLPDLGKPNLVLLAGQMSKLWLVHDAVAEVVGDVAIKEVADPQLAVATGAAVQAATRMITQQELPTDVLLRTQRGFFQVAKRGTALPIRERTVRQALRTPEDRCLGMWLELWEGSEERYDELRLLNKSWLQFPHPLRKDTPVGLSWSMTRDYQWRLVPMLGSEKLTPLSGRSRDAANTDPN